MSAIRARKTSVAPAAAFFVSIVSMGLVIRLVIRLVIGLAIGATISPAFADSGPAAQAPGANAAHASVPAPATTIYWARGADGALSLSDRPLSLAGEQVFTPALSSYEESVARARAEREYWRRQDEAFAARQAQRNALLARAQTLPSSALVAVTPVPIWRTVAGSAHPLNAMPAWAGPRSFSSLTRAQRPAMRGSR
jgi:hypothetical protein